MYSNVLVTQIIINVFEVVAAVVGTVYISKYREDYLSRYFVYFLWFTVFVELVFGWLPAAIYFFKAFSFLKDTIFKHNAWAYNIYDLISFSFYLFFFLRLIEKKKFRKIGYSVVYVFLGYAILGVLFSDFSFWLDPMVNSVIGTFLLLLCVIMYYFQLLLSNSILNFYKSIPFYVSVGALVFHLTINPLFIYENYYKSELNPEFVYVNRIILTLINIFMYTCYIIGFIICLRRNKSYS